MTSTVLSLLAIITILLGYNFLSAEYAKFEALDGSNRPPKGQGRTGVIRDKMAKDLPARIPQPGTPLNLLADRIKSLESEIGTKQATRQKLWDDHPIERYVPTSSTFREIASLDIEIAFLQQGLVYVRKLHTFGAGRLKPNAQIKWLQAAATNLLIRFTRTRKRNGNCPSSAW